MDDLISRQAAIDALIGITTFKTKHELMQRVNASVQDEQGWLGAVAECLDEIEDLPSAQPEQRWIPCSERLPEEYGNYLATMDDGDVQECTFSPEKNTPFMRGGWSTCEADGILFLDIAEVIAWMPLPEPYKAERRTDESD